MNIRKCTSGEALEGNDEHIIGCWKKGNFVIKWQKLGWIEFCCWVDLTYKWIFSWGDFPAKCEMQPDFSLMLTIKWREKRDKLRKDLWKEETSIWWPTEFSVYPNKECALETGPLVWLDRLSLKRLGVWLRDAINHLSRSQEDRRGYPEKTCGKLL